MNQLHGKYVNVVLSVEDGRGMEFVKNKLHITANFNGRILESDSILPDVSVPFNTELIWEVEKKDLRKIRSSNQPLRVECISTDPTNRRDRIGFVMLSLRSAQIVPLKEAKTPLNFKWQKLIGCQTDKKKYHPEIYAALAIRDHLLSEQEEVLPQNTPFISEEENNDEESFESEYPLKYLDDGYIQVGENEENIDSFSLNVLVKEAKNLDTLLPEALVFKQNHEKYHLSFRIFGVTIKTKPFYKRLHEVINLNEKVVVRMLSSEQTLLNFFATQKISITLFNGHEKLGTTDVELGEVTFEEKYLRCFFKLMPPNDIVPFGGDTTSPFIEVLTWIKRSHDYKHKVTFEEKLPPKVVVSSIDRPEAVSACGDQSNISDCVLDKLEQVDVKSKSECRVITDENSPRITKSVDTVIKSIPLSPRVVRKYDVLGEYGKYILEVSLQNLVWKSSPKENIVIFRFVHPRASNYITIFTQIANTIGVKVDLKNIGVKVSYVTASNQIENILNAWPPKLVLTDEKEKLLSEEHEFDASKFFSTERGSYKYVAELKTVRTFQPLAKLQLTLKLSELDICEVEEDQSFYLYPPIVDEILSAKELGDIEKWKKTQKEIHEIELEKLKENETLKLQKEWNKKKQILEETLNSQIEKCKKIQDDLQNKVNIIKTEKYLTRRRNQANIFEEIFKENWEKYKNGDSKEIIEILSKTQRDNEYLKKLVEDQRDKLQALEKSTLTKEQTTSLLQELKGLEKQFEEAQEAKRYFKEQWKSACDQIHEYKTEEYKKLQVDLKKSKEELKYLSLESFSEYISSNQYALNDDEESTTTARSMSSSQYFY